MRDGQITDMAYETFGIIAEDHQVLGFARAVLASRAAVVRAETTPNAGIEAAAALLETKAERHALEYGHDDMGALSFGAGSFGEARHEYHSTLLELAEEIRTLGVISPVPAEPFQARVQPWMMECFGPKIAGDREERNHRFLEESLELVQSTGCTASEAHQLVDYVYGRPVGEPKQEVGGVMVTLAALCLANGLDMHACGETELARIWAKVEQIRAKQAAKPKHSPLPASPVPIHAGDALEDIKDEIQDALKGLEDLAKAFDAVYKSVSDQEKHRWYKAGYFHRINSIRLRVIFSVQKIRDLLAAPSAIPAVDQHAARRLYEELSSRNMETLPIPHIGHGLDFDPDEQHTITDMANVGYSLMEAIKLHRPDYSWSDGPAEIVGDLIEEMNERGDAVHAATSNLPLMRTAFRTTEAQNGPDPKRHYFAMHFSFRSIEDMEAADDEWRALAKATPDATGEKA